MLNAWLDGWAHSLPGFLRPASVLGLGIRDDMRWASTLWLAGAILWVVQLCIGAAVEYRDSAEYTSLAAKAVEGAAAFDRHSLARQWERLRLLRRARHFAYSKQDVCDQLSLFAATINDTFGFYPYAMQVEGAWRMANGEVVEIPTGTGKTLTILMAAVLAYLQGRRVIVLTVNDTLASRDCELGKTLWSLLKVEPVCIASQETHDSYYDKYRRAPVIYTVYQKVVFDYLGNMMGQGIELDFDSHVFLDEIDLLVVDNATSPCIISQDRQAAQGDSERRLMRHGHNIFSMMSAGIHYLDRDMNICLTEEGRDLAREYLVREAGVSGKAVNESPWDRLDLFITFFVQGYRNLYRDIHYVVEDGKVVIVNELTGRLEPDRKFNYPLHTILEYKEGVEFSAENSTRVQKYFQHFIDRFEWKAGCSGTVWEESKEFHDFYGLKTTVLSPPFDTKLTREPTEMETRRYDAVAKCVERVKWLKERGQPVLVICSDMLYVRLLEGYFQKNNIDFSYQKIDALNLTEEALNVARIGMLGQVTISNNATGRGTDVILGGDFRFLSSKLDMVTAARMKRSAFVQVVNRLGGLAIVVLGLNYYARSTRQAEGRSARQVFNGVSYRVYSWEDESVKNLKLSDLSRRLLTQLPLERGVGLVNRTHSFMTYEERLSRFKTHLLPDVHYDRFMRIIDRISELQFYSERDEPTRLMRSVVDLFFEHGGDRAVLPGVIPRLLRQGRWARLRSDLEQTRDWFDQQVEDYYNQAADVNNYMFVNHHADPTVTLHSVLSGYFDRTLARLLLRLSGCFSELHFYLKPVCKTLSSR